ncbi:hypothetical protein CEUSTIGMA_g8826.t1 [Chlamydomonas eustigma]|uniref:ABC transporter domain-containing protein n=1 Tax=Chlamydomonas eustigma TaxID=1157962 RepID=A0A250XE89_9CHLO|nr:hypothetical protein CEUSTIGMA_g8826.t1 [Chlamydomonas eustigma]|eukprot:GAX81395.1 hypothetical protein CEUSTIGMA_g8826.t1 [Chlamydomonas eustigma]
MKQGCLRHKALSTGKAGLLISLHGKRLSSPGTCKPLSTTTTTPLPHKRGNMDKLISFSSFPSASQSGGNPNGSFLSSLMLLAAAASQQQQSQEAPSGATVQVKGLTFHPPGAEDALLSKVDMLLPKNSLNLIFGRSGSGKTTLLQLLAGMCEQTEGVVEFDRTADTSAGAKDTKIKGSSLQERMSRVGLVFQFPERHFLGDTIANELSFAWPPSSETRWLLSNRTQSVLNAVGLGAIPLHLSPYALSGGQQRRLALAVQLIRGPSLLLLDEPLAGLDWQSRAEVASLLRELKKQCTLLVVSHDLQEMAPLVDHAWEMKPGGLLNPSAWPPTNMDIVLGKAWHSVTPHILGF